ncbi:MAG: 4Fe-4S binding protein [Syntrophomonadaceae bacterium]
MSKISRRVIQVITVIGINSYFIGFTQGSIYKGKLKNICVPGLNCSSCPGSWGSCPLAMLQTGIADMVSSQFKLFIFGFLALAGVILGRFACGWFCPFGLIQELIYKIPLPKLALPEGFKRLENLKYVVLIVFVLLLPALGAYGMSSTAFCKYLCPVEVLEASLPMMMVRPSIIETMGFLFKWKLLFLIALLLLALVIFKPFCRFICPLGAIYSLFNPISLYRLEVDQDKCTKCGICQDHCKFAIKVYEEPNNRECMRCNECLVCPTEALTIKGYGKKKGREIELS